MLSMRKGFIDIIICLLCIIFMYYNISCNYLIVIQAREKNCNILSAYVCRLNFGKPFIYMNNCIRDQFISLVFDSKNSLQRLWSGDHLCCNYYPNIYLYLRPIKLPVVYWIITENRNDNLVILWLIKLQTVRRDMSACHNIDLYQLFNNNILIKKYIYLN